MRLKKTDIVAGLPAAEARELARLYYSDGPLTRAARVVGDGRADASVQSLVEAGYLRLVDSTKPQRWITTTSGNALAQASFGNPISRRTADRLVAELVDRARAINANPSYLVSVARLRAFGSYLQEDVDPLGDVDVELVVAFRTAEDERIEAVRAYNKASGRRFNSYLEELFWPETELRQLLKNRSPAISITQENVDLLTDQVRVIYAIEDDGHALPANGGRRAFS